MRLVDADALKSKMTVDALGGHKRIWVCGVIDDAPTIDAQPVKRGQWSECWRDPVKNVISVICSACGDASIAYLPKRDLTVDDAPKGICMQMPYCPKCCADMRGDADER